jgi:hypothetical protein
MATKLDFEPLPGAVDTIMNPEFEEAFDGFLDKLYDAIEAGQIDGLTFITTMTVELEKLTRGNLVNE